MQEIRVLISALLQKFDLETTSSFRYAVVFLSSLNQPVDIDFRSDQRVAGYVTGYVRRFWQVRLMDPPHPNLMLTYI